MPLINAVTGRIETSDDESSPLGREAGRQHEVQYNPTDTPAAPAADTWQ